MKEGLEYMYMYLSELSCFSITFSTNQITALDHLQRCYDV